MYYKNQPCQVLSEFGHKAVISIHNEWEAGGYPDGSYVDYQEFEYELIVDKKDLHEKPFLFEEEFNQKKREIELEISKIRKEKLEELKKIDEEIDKRKEEKQDWILKASKYEGMVKMLKFLRGDYKYVLINSNKKYGFVIDLKDAKCSNNEKQLCAVKFRTNMLNGTGKTGEVKCYLDEYSDGSGRGQEITKFLQTDDEAREEIRDLFEKERLKTNTVTKELLSRLNMTDILKTIQERDDLARKEHLQQHLEKKRKEIFDYVEDAKKLGINLEDIWPLTNNKST